MTFSDDLVARELGATDLELGIFTPTTYRVFIRDRSLRIIDQLDEWTSLRLVRRFNDTGTFQLVISRESLLAQSLVKGGGIVVKRRIGDSGDFKTIFSGRIEGSYTRTARTLTVSGFDDNVYLETPARPTPSLATAPYPDEYDVATGVASSIMMRLVNLNIGPLAPVEWRVPGLVMAADPNLGGIVTTRARFDSLRTQLTAVSVTPVAGGLGWEIIQSDTADATLEFRVYQPRNLSASALFSVELGSVQDFEDTWTAPSGNYFIVAGGDGLGGDRPIVEGGDAASIDDIGRRKPVFIDARGITDSSELNQKLAEAIAGAVASRKTTITPFEIPSLIFGEDYELGDLVAYTVRDPVTTGTDTYTDLIREIDVDLSPSKGAIVVPMIGQAGTTNDDTVAQYIASVQDRLGNIERNWNIPDDSIIPAMLTPGTALANLGAAPVIQGTLGIASTVAGDLTGVTITNPAGGVSGAMIRLEAGALHTTFGLRVGTSTFLIIDTAGLVAFEIDGTTSELKRYGHTVWDDANAPASADVHSVQGKVPGAATGNLAILDSNARARDSALLLGKAANATPAANIIPIADGSGKLDSGWLPAVFLALAGGTLTGDLLFSTDNSHDLGSGSFRPRTIYFGTSLIGKGGEAVQKQSVSAFAANPKTLGFSYASFSPAVSVALSVGEWMVDGQFSFASVGDSGTYARGKLHIVSGTATIANAAIEAVAPFTVAGYKYYATRRWRVTVTAASVIELQVMIDGGGGNSIANSAECTIEAAYHGNP